MLKPATCYYIDTQRDLTNNLFGSLTGLLIITMHRARKWVTTVLVVGLVLLLWGGFPTTAKAQLRAPYAEPTTQTAELAKELHSHELLVPLKEIPGFPSQAVVTLVYLGRQQEGEVVEWPRVAFAIGDGTILLTAAHCVTGFNDSRSQAVSPNILVISPYYGDIFEFKILAVDKKADLAVLKAPWPSSPW